MNTVYKSTAPIDADDQETDINYPVEPQVTPENTRYGPNHFVDDKKRKVNVHGYPTTQEKKHRHDTLSDFEDTRLLGEVERRSEAKLFSLETVFPFDILPNTIAIDENKVDITVRQLFHSEQLHSLLISDIKTVTVTASIIFASMFFEVEGYETNPPVIPYIWKADAYTARDIIQGLITCKTEGIDVSKFNDEDITERLKKIGHVQS